MDRAVSAPRARSLPFHYSMLGSGKGQDYQIGRHQIGKSSSSLDPYCPERASRCRCILHSSWLRVMEGSAARIVDWRLALGRQPDDPGELRVGVRVSERHRVTASRRHGVTARYGVTMGAKRLLTRRRPVQG